MYVPPYESLLRALNTDLSTVERAGSVTIPLPLLKLFLQIAIASGEFDEDEYLEENPDVRAAVNGGSVESGLIHYIGFGYLEGRKGGVPVVDDRWYSEKYPDVAAAVKTGKIPSVKDHFYAIGAGEGRSPNSNEVENAMQWKTVLVR